MPAKRKSLGVRAQIDHELDELEERRGRLLAARAALDGEAVLAKEKPRRLSQDEVAAYLKEHSASTYTEVAEGLGANPVNVAALLSRGGKTGRFRNDAGKWNLEE